MIESASSPTETGASSYFFNSAWCVVALVLSAVVAKALCTAGNEAVVKPITGGVAGADILVDMHCLGVYSGTNTATAQVKRAQAAPLFVVSLLGRQRNDYCGRGNVRQPGDAEGNFAVRTIYKTLVLSPPGAVL